jgi:hypothetical protein
LKEQLHHTLSVVALVAYFIPILTIAVKNLWKDIPVLVFSFYWAMGGLIHLVFFLPGLSTEAVNRLCVVYNIMDVPIVLFILYMNTKLGYMKRFIRFITPLYFIIEILNGILRGFTVESYKYFLAVGVLIILIAVVAEIFSYFQKMQHSPREKAIIFLYIAVFFEYALYVVVYIFTYIIIIDEKKDNDILYDLSTLLGIIIASFGFLSRNIKHKAAYPKNG